MTNKRFYTFDGLANNKANTKELLEILKVLNNDYPVPLVNKIDLLSYVNKIMTNGYVLTARYDNKIIGFATFYANNYEINEASFSLLGVLKEYRNFGVARELFEESFKLMRSKGMKTVYSFTHKDNLAGIKFHESLSFIIDETRLSTQEYNVSLIKTL